MKRIPEETRIQQINSLPNTSFVRWDGEYKNNTSKAVCRCLVDGFEWATKINNLLSGGKWCPQCNGGGLIAELEKELHSWTEQAEFREPFDGYTEWRKWDDRIPMWIEEYRARA